jgi:hypothetical protein
LQESAWNIWRKCCCGAAIAGIEADSQGGATYFRTFGGAVDANWNMDLQLIGEPAR